MDKLKTQIQQKLVATVIVDKCSNCSNLIFRDAWCTQERVIRFTTPVFRKLFSVTENNRGKWSTGDFVMYEAHNSAKTFTVNCVMNLSDASNEQYQMALHIYRALLLPVGRKNDDVILKSWDLPSYVSDHEQLFQDFDRLINKEVPCFEKDLHEKIGKTVLTDDELREGSEETYRLNKYERSRKARDLCLAAHGTACTVCGIDFAKAYGPEFAGKIEVHHIIPLSEIGETYVVDPVNDLVPVCPNCHTALHSKKDGVYTIEELKALRKKAERE